MKISIIVPVHNAENTIRRCVQSILMQNMDEIEILLIENGSVDSSYEICKDYAKRYDNVFCYSSTKGVSAARNVGLKYATGDIIGFCDSDDEFINGSFEKIVNAFEYNKEISLVVGGYYRVSSKNKFYMGFKKNSVCSFKRILNHSIYDFRIMGSVWNKFFKIELLKGFCFDETLTYCEDTHFLISVLSKNQNQKAYILNKPIYCYICNEQSVTRNTSNLFNELGQLKYIEALEKILELPDLKKYSRILIKRQIFWLSIEWYPYVSKEKERKMSRRYIWCYLPFYLICIYVSPKQVPRTIVIMLREQLRKLFW